MISDSPLFGKTVEPLSRSAIGMHVSYPSAPSSPVTPLHVETLGYGSVRGWDDNSTWRQIETTAKGAFNWAAIDNKRAAIRDAGLTYGLNLSMAPDWATTPNVGGSGARNPYPLNNVQDLVDFTVAYLTRYPDTEWVELGNEPNDHLYWLGSIEQQIAMIQAVYPTVKAINPTIKVVSACPTSLAFGLPWLDQYVRGGAAGYFDVLSFHIYPLTNDPRPPEHQIALLRMLHGARRAYGLDQCEIWATECGYASWYDEAGTLRQTPEVMPQAKAAAYTARIYLCSLGMADRVYLYALDRSFMSLRLIDLDNRSAVLPAGQALGVLSAILVGCTLGAVEQRGPLFSRRFFGSRRGEVYWCADGQSRTVNLTRFTSALNILGETVPVSANTLISDSPLYALD